MQERFPGPARRGGVLVGQIHQFHPLFAHQPGDLGGEFHRVAVAPAGPEPALAAKGAQMRAAARELQNHRPLAAPIGIVGEVDQLPADAQRVQVFQHRRRGGGVGLALTAKGNARNCGQIGASRQRVHQVLRRHLALAPHDHIHGGAFGQNLGPMIAGIGPAIDDPRIGQRGADQRGQMQHCRMRRGGAGMPDQHRLGRSALQIGDNGLGPHRCQIGVQQIDRMPRNDPGAADRQKVQRRQQLPRHARADGGMGRVQQRDAQGQTLATSVATGKPPLRGRPPVRASAREQARNSVFSSCSFRNTPAGGMHHRPGAEVLRR